MAKLNHLSETASQQLDKSIEERKLYIQRLHFIRYGRAEKVLDRLKYMLNYPKKLRMPGLLIFGPPNNGKTEIITKFFNENLPSDNANGERIEFPVLLLEPPPVPDEMRLYRIILDTLKVASKEYSKLGRLEAQVKQVLNEIRLKMIIIDEIHNFIAGSTTKQKAFLNVLKRLHNTLQIPFVFAGTEYALSAMQVDPQISSRFSPMCLPAWKKSQDLVDLLATIETEMPLREPSNLVGKYQDILEISGATIGGIVNTIVTATEVCIDSGQSKIDQKIFDRLKNEKKVNKGEA
jgi:SpoVK/Ycf46/Vps4 family AAA+-type ATPase